MTPEEQSPEQRLSRIERRLRRERAAFGAMLAGVALIGWTPPQGSDVQDSELRVRRLTVEDENGVARVVVGDLGEREPGTAFGIAINDAGGAERFGVSVFSDERVAMGFDAPPGVGHPMRDRLGLGVGPTGHAFLMFLNNDTTSPLRLYTTDDDEGLVEFIDWDRSAENPTVRGYQRYGLSETYVEETP